MADEINEEITDLTEPELSGEEESAAPQPVRAPRQPRPPKPVEEAPATGKKKKAKKKKGGKLKIILIIAIPVLIAAFIFEELYYNYLGLRDVFIDAVFTLDPDRRTREQDLDEWEQRLVGWETALDLRERLLDSRESSYSRDLAELRIKEAQVIEKEESLLPLYRRLLTEQELLEMQSLSRTYTQMTPESAAAILVELHEPEDVAAILFYMVERYRAAILAVMEPEYAAELTEILLYR